MSAGLPDKSSRNALPALVSNLSSLSGVAYMDLSETRIATCSKTSPTGAPWHYQASVGIPPVPSGATGSSISLLTSPRLDRAALDGLRVDPAHIPRDSETAGAIHVHSLRTGEEVVSMRVSSGGVTCLCLSADGHAMCSGGTYDILLWGLGGDGKSTKIGSHTGRVSGVCFGPGLSSLASGSKDWTVKLWDLHQGSMKGQLLDGHTGPVLSVASSSSRDGGWLVASGGSDDQGAIIWDVRTKGIAPAPQPPIQA